jgi:hypothetical protein
MEEGWAHWKLVGQQELREVAAGTRSSEMVLSATSRIGGHQKIAVALSGLPAVAHSDSHHLLLLVTPTPLLCGPPSAATNVDPMTWGVVLLPPSQQKCLRFVKIEMYLYAFSV